jgi:hypothetical protein
MSTEIILVEVSVYEKNLKELLSEYERIHTNYISSLQDKNMQDAKRLLLQLESMNQEIQSLSEEISQKIKQINQENKYGEYKNAIQQKKNDLTTLNNKMVTDETRVKKLLHDTIDLDAKNETLRLQQKSSMYHIYFAIVIVIVLSIFFFRFAFSSEQDPIENIVLFFAIVLIVYFSWANIVGWWTSLVSSIAKNINYDYS